MHTTEDTRLQQQALIAAVESNRIGLANLKVAAIGICVTVLGIAVAAFFDWMTISIEIARDAREKSKSAPTATQESARDQSKPQPDQAQAASKITPRRRSDSESREQWRESENAKQLPAVSEAPLPAPAPDFDMFGPPPVLADVQAATPAEYKTFPAEPPRLPVLAPRPANPPGVPDDYPGYVHSHIHPQGATVCPRCGRIHAPAVFYYHETVKRKSRSRKI